MARTQASVSDSGRNRVFLANAAPETIRAGLETLLADPAAARTRAENARQNLCSHFTWQAVFATMMEAVTSAKRS